MRYTEAQINEVSTALSKESDIALHKRFQILLLRMRGTPVYEITAVTGASQPTIWRICSQYQKHGLSGMRPVHRGGNRKLTQDAEATILQCLEAKATSGQYSRVAELQADFEAQSCVSYHPYAFYRLLRRHGWRKVVPRSQHPKVSDAASCEDVKKLT